MRLRPQAFYFVLLAAIVLAAGASMPVISGGSPGDGAGLAPNTGDMSDQVGSRGSSRPANPWTSMPMSKGGHDDDDDDDDDDGGEIPFDEANLYLELNHTDSDLGIHGLIDGDAWKLLEIESPDERQNLKVAATGSLRKQGMTEFFFESDEPQFPDEISLRKFFGRFPAGTWEISGVTLEGDELESEVELSHVLAAPPEDIMVNDEMAAENCDADDLPVVSEPVTISWEEVIYSHPTVGDAGDIEVVTYQLVVEREELIFSVDLPPDVTSFEIPEDFTGLGDEFKFEIIVKTDTGNQTAVESCFEID